MTTLTSCYWMSRGSLSLHFVSLFRRCMTSCPRRHCQVQLWSRAGLLGNENPSHCRQQIYLRCSRLLGVPVTRVSGRSGHVQAPEKLTPGCAAHDAASVRRYMSWSSPVSRLLLDKEGMWPASSAPSGASCAMMPAMPPKTGAVRNGGLSCHVQHRTRRDRLVFHTRNNYDLLRHVSSIHSSVLVSFKSMHKARRIARK